MTNNIHTYQKRSTQLLHTLFIILLLGMMWGCIDESVNDIPITGGKGKMVTFALKVPGVTTPDSSGPSTYALSASDEGEVSTIVAIPFGSNGRTISEAIYLTSSDITIDTNGNIKTFTILVGEDAYDVVVLANISPSLVAELNSVTAGQSKEWVSNRLLLTNNGKWNAAHGSAGYIPIPMWGESALPSLSGDAPINISVTLTRMLSKIDVVLTKDNEKSKLDLQSVRLYNYNNQGLVVPPVSNWNTIPSIPSSAQKISAPLLYDGSAITKESGRGVASINELYAFEALAGNGNALLENTCIVIGGKYNGATNDSYYRIDFANTAGTGASATTTYLSLLRNYNYKINIDDIKGAGFATPEEAFRSLPVNIVANIVNWNDAQMGDINFDGQYILGVSKGAFIFSREARNANSEDNTLIITTDYPTGWKVEKIVDSEGNDVSSATNPATGWLRLSPSSVGSGATTNAKILMTENSSGVKRNGLIHLSAGRITYIVKVEQSATQDLSISIVDGANQPVDTLMFGAKVGEKPATQQMTLSWLPVTSSITYLNTPGDNPFIFSEGAGYEDIPSSGAISDPSGNGTIEYAIAPPAITTTQTSLDPFFERNSSILYTLSDGATAVYRVVNFKQIAYNMIPIVEEEYRMDGGLKSFRVRANVPFTVAIKSNPGSVISELSTTGIANTDEMGTAVNFRVKDDITNPTLFQRDVVVTIKSPTGLFDDYDVTLKCRSAIAQPEANSYIVAPDGLGILIPFTRANVAATTTLTAELVWTDNLNGLAANSNIKTIKITGSGTSRYLYITPGTAEGNALVAIKSGNTIIWSWHIWVTNYNPISTVSGTFMDRNLGAIGNTPGGVDIRGFLYQWGRKDPFPGSQTLYNASGGTVGVSYDISWLSARNRFSESFENPTTYYAYSLGTSTNDWIGPAYPNKRDDLWDKNGSKTNYDPCPPGWRVPLRNVLNAAISNSTWTNNGRTNSSNGGYFPAAGARPYSNSGRVEGVGSRGYYWSASPDGNDSRLLYFDSGQVSTRSSMRSDALSVRCVKE